MVGVAQNEGSSIKEPNADDMAIDEVVSIPQRYEQSCTYYLRDY